MKGKAKSENFANPVFLILFLAGTFLCIVSLLIAYIICIDRADELFNYVRHGSDWRTQRDLMYQNEWNPFQKDSYMAAIQAIPRHIYIAFGYFPTSALIGLIFFPLMIVVVPFYEAYMGQYLLLLYGWLPFAAGVLVLVAAGLMAEMSKAEKRSRDNLDNL
ncbi:MAG: hypothetical protein IT558_04245 [Alphaproteobacteria bacterium]|nr:hypothetical protein [Alphaproteobacteria bacterium]